MNQYYFCAREFIIWGNEIWYIPLGYKYLCCFDLEKRKNKEQILIPNNQELNSLYESVHIVNDKFYFIPCNADYILIFYINNKTFEMIPIPTFRKRNITFYASYLYGESLYLFPRYAFNSINPNTICVINTKTNEVKYEWVCKEIFPKLADKDIVFGRESFEYKNSMLISDAKRGIIKFDLSSDRVLLDTAKCVVVNRKPSAISKIDEDRICYADELGNIIVYDLHNEQEVISENKLDGFIPRLHKYYDSECFGYSIKYKNTLYFFPSDSNKVLEYDINNKRLNEAVFSTQICTMMQKFKRFYIGQFSKPYIVGDMLYVWNVWSEVFYIINLITQKVDKICIEAYMDEQQLLLCYTQWKKKGGVERRSFYTDLNAMLRYIKTDIGKEHNQIHKEGLVGEMIWSRVKRK